MNKKIIQELLADQWEAVQEQGFLTRAFNWEENLNYCLVGIRRAGKSYLLIQRIHELLKEGVPEDHILYVNFEDERLPELTAEERAQYAAGHCEVCPHCRGPAPDVVGLKYCPHCGFEVSTKKNRQAFWEKFFYCLFVAILMIALFVMMWDVKSPFLVLRGSLWNVVVPYLFAKEGEQVL